MHSRAVWSAISPCLKQGEVAAEAVPENALLTSAFKLESEEKSSNLSSILDNDGD